MQFQRLQSTPKVSFFNRELTTECHLPVGLPSAVEVSPFFLKWDLVGISHCPPEVFSKCSINISYIIVPVYIYLWDHSHFSVLQMIALIIYLNDKKQYNVGKSITLELDFMGLSPSSPVSSQMTVVKLDYVHQFPHL